jgi:hypothetical protein
MVRSLTVIVPKMIIDALGNGSIRTEAIGGAEHAKAG